MEKNKLRGRIVEIFGSQAGFAEALGQQPATVSRKLNELRDLRRSEIEEWARLLKIRPDEIPKYFFAE